MSEPLIRVEGLRFAHDDGTVALDGVDFTLMPGETVAVFGPNGAGKTTFAHHLNGLLTGPGNVTICGLPVEKGNLAEIRRLVGLLFQDPDDQLFMPTVLDDVLFGPLNLGWDRDLAHKKAHQALRSVGMSEAAAKAPHRLSAGEKKRVALAGILAMEPRILVLDEPTTYLDPTGQQDLLELLRGLPQAKVVVTHDTWFARALAARAVFFRAGRVAGTGTVDQVLRQFSWGWPAERS